MGAGKWNSPKRAQGVGLKISDFRAKKGCLSGVCILGCHIGP